MELIIGGVALHVYSEKPLRPLRSPGYDSFARASADLPPAASSLSVEVTDSLCPPNDSPLMFDSAGAWYLQPDPQGYRLTLRRGADGPPFTVAVSDAATENVTVHVRQDRAAPDGRAAAGSGADVLPNPVDYPLDQLLMMNHLATRDGVILHAAGVALRGRGLVFPGASGAGKSTLARLLSDAGMGDAMLSDDRVIVRQEAGAGLRAWGTPWHGDAHIANNLAAPPAALAFLVHGEQTGLHSLQPSAALKRLLPVATLPWYDQERLSAALTTCSRIVEEVPCFELRFRPDAEVAAVVERMV